jgi:predicted ferric reductase
MSSKRFWQHAEVPMRGFGGDFKLQTAAECDDVLPFVAGGIGITPLLGQLPGIDYGKLKLFWTLSVADINLAVDVLKTRPGLGASTRIFLTQVPANLEQEQEDAISVLRNEGAEVQSRRLAKEDLDSVESNTWYLCAATGLQKALLEMLKGKKVVFESFNY